DEQLEHPALSLAVHRVDERLVAVAEVDAAPLRRRRDDGVRPGAVGEVDGGEGGVAGRLGHAGHGCALLGRISDWRTTGTRQTPQRGAGLPRPRYGRI